MENIKIESAERLRLHQLENAGIWVFHGSEDKIDELEPRQAYNTKDGKKVEDDEPAVHASPMVDIAIMMAIINIKNCPRGFNSGFEYRKGKLILHASKESLVQLENDSFGYVYVLPKKDFKPRGIIQSISYAKSRPYEIIKVKKIDLPEIEIRES